jgi:hypothetical protein
LVAKGKQTPQKPFFFLHEYKPENKKEGDPVGQLLIGMVAAQRENNDEKPLYGCYISGRNWFFVFLDQKKYAISNAFNATEYPDFTKILSILFYTKDKMKHY